MTRQPRCVYDGMAAGIVEGWARLARYQAELEG
jgi:hypothetical protein